MVPRKAEEKKKKDEEKKKQQDAAAEEKKRKGKRCPWAFNLLARPFAWLPAWVINAWRSTSLPFQNRVISHIHANFSIFRRSREKEEE